MSGGPKPMERAERLALSREIAERAMSVRAGDIKAVGLYGSTARGTDGPYSDIEMLCVLSASDEDYSHEWSAGPWKAEVDFIGEKPLLTRAATVEGDWSLTHGAFYYTLGLHDPGDFFAELRNAVVSQPDEAFRKAIREVVVGDLYEEIGKLRNALHAGHTSPIPELAMGVAKWGAYVTGLSNRHLYTTGSRVLEEAVAQPDRPEGLEGIADLVMTGRLSDFRIVAEACEAFWEGLEAWAREHGIEIEERRRIPF